MFESVPDYPMQARKVITICASMRRPYCWKIGRIARSPFECVLKASPYCGQLQVIAVLREWTAALEMLDRTPVRRTGGGGPDESDVQSWDVSER